MAFAFDTLGYAKRLRDGGVPSAQAEAHAEAAREFIMVELATGNDIGVLKSAMAALEQRLQLAMDNLVLRLTVRMGVMMAAGIALLATLQKLN